MADRSPDLQQTLSDLVIANRILAYYRVLDAFGHISARHPDDPEKYLLARSLAPHLITAEDVLTFSLASDPLDANGRHPYAERFIHGEIYKARPEVQSVCHNHAYTVIPFGITPTPLRPVLHNAAVLGPEIPVWDIRTNFGDTDLLVTSQEKGASLARTLGPRRVALMRGHGSVVAGAGIRETVFAAYYLMVNAEVLRQTLTLGPAEAVLYLSPGEIEAISAMILQPLSQDRFWQGMAAAAGFPGLP